MDTLKYLFTALLCPFFLAAQDYSDVAVIVNINATASVEVGTYFQQQREIPPQNILEISTSTEEEIDEDTFAELRDQVESQLDDNGLLNSINYLVTTKGVPLKVARGDCWDESMLANCSAVDSELALLFSDWSDQISQSGPVTNPYFEENGPFSRAVYGIFLVTRLDGYTVDDVKNLIDRSGPATGVNQETSRILLDISGDLDSSQVALNYNGLHAQAAQSCEDFGWDTTIDLEPPLATEAVNLLLYSSFDFFPGEEIPGHTWVAGSFADVIWEHSAATFDPAVNGNNGLQVADLIAEGATAAQGAVYLNFIHSSALRLNLFVDRYLSTPAQYNFAESIFMSLPRLSWMNIAIGDPKASLQIDNTINGTIAPALSANLEIYPNPSLGQVTVQFPAEELEGIQIFNGLGQLVYQRTYDRWSGKEILDLSSLIAGLYWVEVMVEDQRKSFKLIISE
ncbi:MAG: TIGR03790 family protein [Bacteroidota bacterium]